MSPNKIMAKPSRGKGWTDPEVHVMLDAVEVHLPWGPAHWDIIRETYNTSIQANDGWPARDVDSIRRKFKVLRSIRKPTGDPMCPPTVTRAKRLQQAIEAAMGVCDLPSCEQPPNEGNDSEGASDGYAAPIDALVECDAVATQRTGLSPAELIALGTLRGAEPARSETAVRRRNIDDMLNALADNKIEKQQRMESGMHGATLIDFVMKMEERDAAFRTQQLEMQERREKFDQCMLAVFTKLLDK
ncbi:hypothetical protein H257_12086 [Aphanomyces astaci]|uniref:DUF6818 domain-containing protein n=1 Tax=Aphanomyces astaci TaxID=112090 RepID=W4G049_APHAT|nr:hypothetical protein H257_12086 [Aphanomyces astaci]ETV73050.1 hypothetical protein H257_12086 [Aphanomyces astaci]|eukprot:XP_009837499.1 hypothetical protein H257_12086 [Aphanomyces astaci]